MGPLKTLHLIGSKSLGGAERWFLRFVRALAQYEEETHLGIRSTGALVEADWDALPVHRLPFRTVWDPWSRREVQRLIATLKPDIVQTYLGRATRLTRRRAGQSFVHVARLGGYYALPPFRHADAWIGNTRGLCDWMIRQGLPAHRVYRIPNFAEPAHPVAPQILEDLRVALDLPRDAWVLTTAGRFVPVKGLDVLLAALARLPSAIQGRPWCLVLLGAGPLKGQLMAQARGLGLMDRIRWAGWRPDPGPFFQLADLVVFPSREEETLGNVILESWAWSRPLVTTRFRGAREIACHGEDAWCVPCEDPAGLARGIRILLEDPGLADSLRRRGRARVQGEFSRDTVLRAYRDLYRHLLGR